MNIYCGTLGEEYQVTKNGKPFDPEPSLKVRNHSPDGFAFGYGGSGPAQLALAILLEETTQEEAEKYYQEFKWQVIAHLPRSKSSGWSLTSIMVKEWLSKMLAAAQFLESEN